VVSSGDPLASREGDDDDAPSELLAPLLEEWRDVLVKHVLERLDPTDCAMLARVGKPWLAVVLANHLPRAGKGGAVPLKVKHFVGSVERLAWAKDNGCPWEAKTCFEAAAGGKLEVVQWAREHDCPWDVLTCAWAAEGGHLDVLRWAREHDCPWDEMTCEFAAESGHLEVLKWARAHDCPWNAMVCARAAYAGNLEVLRWAREHGCEWGLSTCEFAAAGGRLEAGAYTRPLLSSICALSVTQVTP
jgi:hypothetical protein